MKKRVQWWWSCGLKRSITPDCVLTLNVESLNMDFGNVVGIDRNGCLGWFSRVLGRVLQEKWDVGSGL
jgi:hypothetical protein